MEKKANYKLIALDMDGTLLMSDKTVHPDTIRDIEQAGARGIHVVYCSGRAVPELLPYTSILIFNNFHYFSHMKLLLSAIHLSRKSNARLDYYR